MSKLAIGGAATGTATFNLSAPATNTNRTITLPDTSGQVSVLDLRAAQSATGLFIDFPNIPATARRVTVFFDGVSTNGTSVKLVQLGSTSIQTTGYVAMGWGVTGASQTAAGYTIGFGLQNAQTAAELVYGSVVFTLMGSNKWVCKGGGAISGGATGFDCSGGVSLSGLLDRIRVTTVNGTDQFDAGTISILVE